jgi:hypothetical protein
MNSVEFYVRDVRRTSAGETLVVGVANNRRALSVGDRFRIRYEVSRDDAMNCSANPARLRNRVVDLVVEKIDVMRSQVAWVTHGRTAALWLAGHGLEHLKKGCFLRTMGS